MLHGLYGLAVLSLRPAKSLQWHSLSFLRSWSCRMHCQGMTQTYQTDSAREQKSNWAVSNDWFKTSQEASWKKFMNTLDILIGLKNIEIVLMLYFNISNPVGWQVSRHMCVTSPFHYHTKCVVRSYAQHKHLFFKLEDASNFFSLICLLNVCGSKCSRIGDGI